MCSLQNLKSAEEKAAQEMANKVAEMARMESLYKDKQDDTEVVPSSWAATATSSPLPYLGVFTMSE